jgi:hypothetical protein
MNFSKEEKMQIEFIYPKHYDLIFHVLAYFKVNNASNLYDERYIEKIANEKARFIYDIKPAVNSLQVYYNENFERLMLINFLPFYCNGYDEMKNTFLSCNRFTQDDIELFIKPFIEMLDNESKFFFDYWEALNKKYESVKRSTENYFTRELEKYSCVFDYFDKPCKVLYSFIITQNGRGFHSDTHFAALIRFPENEAAFNFSFIQLLHEYTHNFTDGLLNKNINMKDGSHTLSENVVIVVDYYLIKSIDENFIPQYFEWLKNGRNEDIDEQKFLSLFNFDENLKTELMRLIRKILESHTE